MTQQDRTPDSSCQLIIKIIQESMQADRPFVVALDGGSGAGKSTITDCLAQHLSITVIPCDDFFAADIPDHEWLTRSPAERVRDAINWRRIRKEALEPLIAGQVARWHPFDFEAGLSTDGTYAMKADYVERKPNPVIILDGIYSARPELADIVDLSVLVDVPLAERHQRLDLREDAEFLKAWHERWDDAEAYYFTHIKPSASFDVIVSNNL